MEYTTFLNQFKQLVEQTTRYTPPNLRGDRGDWMDNYDRYVDFPYVDDPEPFVTHRTLEQDAPPGPPALEDQDDEIKEQSAKGRTTGSPKEMEAKLATEEITMEIKDLKIKAGDYVVTRENLSSSEKLQLIEFIRSAEEEQVMYLLLEGNMVQADKLDHDEVKKMFTESGAKRILQEIDPITVTTVGSVMVIKVTPGVVALAYSLLYYKIIQASFRIYKDYLNNTLKKCKHFKHRTFSRKKCEAAAKIGATDTQIKAIQDAASKNCKNTKNPGKCVAAIKKKIVSLNTKKQKLKHRIAKIEVKASKQGLKT